MRVMNLDGGDAVAVVAPLAGEPASGESAPRRIGGQTSRCLRCETATGAGCSGRLQCRSDVPSPELTGQPIEVELSAEDDLLRTRFAGFVKRLELKAESITLTATNVRLRAKLGMDSKNSPKPPSSGGNLMPPPTSRRRSGGK